MESDPDIELRAENDRVRGLFSTENLVERLVDLVAGEEIFSPPTAWRVDETLMPFLANNGGDDDDALELLPDLSQPGPKPDSPGRRSATATWTSSAAPRKSHADAVNVYNAPVTINNYGAAIEGDSSWEVDAD
jgi:hypothetical protein